MRRKQRKSGETDSLLVLAEAPEHHLATSNGEGEPVLRVLNGVVVRDWILFHGALAGEKSGCMGRRAVVSAYRVVADIPSHFVDPQKACPATTFYRSVQVKGTLKSVDDLSLKREMMQSLMDKLQPEGGYCSFADHEDLYRVDLRSVRVFGFQIEEVTGKLSLGQDRPPARTMKVVQGLWGRGKQRDLPAIEEILLESPGARPAKWLREGSHHIVVHSSPQLIAEHSSLLVGSYWRETCTELEQRGAISESDAWVGALDESGELIGAARAISDRLWNARISDVVVRKDWRSQGVGRHLLETLLDHPMLRHCRIQRLGTRDTVDFYKAQGFVLDVQRRDSTPIHSMVRRRPDELRADPKKELRPPGQDLADQ